MESKRFSIKVIAAIVWLVFTSSLIVWWMYFAMDLLEQIEGVGSDHRTMLLLEGLTLLLCLVGGGVTLIYLIFQENQRVQSLSEFFATFSHEIKTALSSLRLQAESLADEVEPEAQKRLLGRLLVDTSRLAVSVENSLFVAEERDKKSILLDLIDLTSVKDELQLSWPQLEIALQGTSNIRTDRRALMSILQNLVHNASQHGHASRVAIQLNPNGTNVDFVITDNGSGFDGDRRRLGERSYRPKSTSGSGLGLSIVASLIQKLNGRGPSFPLTGPGFKVEFTLPQEGGQR
jgi:signal transduction histidine kinase